MYNELHQQTYEKPTTMFLPVLHGEFLEYTAFT